MVRSGAHALSLDLPGGLALLSRASGGCGLPYGPVAACGRARAYGRQCLLCGRPSHRFHLAGPARALGPGSSARRGRRGRPCASRGRRGRRCASRGRRGRPCASRGGRAQAAGNVAGSFDGPLPRGGTGETLAKIFRAVVASQNHPKTLPKPSQNPPQTLPKPSQNSPKTLPNPLPKPSQDRKRFSTPNGY